LQRNCIFKYLKVVICQRALGIVCVAFSLTLARRKSFFFHLKGDFSWNCVKNS